MESKNRLAAEKSPYLLQHADNPVHWFPWSEEAFQKARLENKPVFLSIGYSTCHWCHVMEHESFENLEIAKILNDHFVSIKVDREERPDIDNIYMKVVTALTGHGGWPLSVFLTSEKKPFYGGTYFPPESRWGTPGFKDLLLSIYETWIKKREQVVKSSDSITQLLRDRVVLAGRDEAPLDEKILEKAYRQFSQSFDSQYGGFGQAPKFPTPHNLSFLLRYAQRKNQPQALQMVETTLTRMAQGGLSDHMGGGFHRYSTDREWQIPHFEKMLYDQALLTRTYLEAYQMTRNEEYARIARKTLEYILRDMKDPKGGFYSAEDADSYDPAEFGQMSVDSSQKFVKKEGAFYLWTAAELMRLLDEKELDVFSYYYGIENQGNAKWDPHGEFQGKNILYVAYDLTATASHFHLSESEIRSLLARCGEKLFAVRERRPRPHLDDKILTDWNGLMISSLAFASRVLEDPSYLKAAEEAAQFILHHLIRGEDRLLHRYRDGEAAIQGTVEDYAFFIHGLIDLYEASFEPEYLQWAVRLARNMVDRFWDAQEGGFFFTAADGEELLIRQKEIYDGAIPSGNALGVLNLLRLYHLTMEQDWFDKVDKALRAFGLEVSAQPSAYTYLMIALDYYLGPSQEIVFAGNPDDPMIQNMLREVYKRFLPNKVVLMSYPSGPQAEVLGKLAPFTKNQRPLKGLPTAYVCQNHQCKLPVQDVEKLIPLLEGKL